MNHYNKKIKLDNLLFLCSSNDDKQKGYINTSESEGLSKLLENISKNDDVLVLVLTDKQIIIRDILKSIGKTNDDVKTILRKCLVLELKDKGYTSFWL